MARVRGIGGIFFKSENPEALRAWYARHLGIVSEGDSGTTFLSPDPPNHADGGRLLFFAQHSIPVGEKRRLVREVPAPFIAHQEALSKFVIESGSSFLQGLREPAEESAAVGEIFRPAAHSDLWSELITCVRGATDGVGRRRGMPRR